MQKPSNKRKREIDDLKSRPSPAYYAKDFPNKIHIGNDEREYISAADINGVFRWKLYKLLKYKWIFVDFSID